MKKIISAAACLIFSVQCFSQEILRDSVSKNNYVFIGGVNKEKIKVLGKGNRVEWKDMHGLVPAGYRTSADFLRSIFKSHLYFECEGDEPFWKAGLSAGQFSFTDGSTGKEKKYQVIVNTNDGDIDESFSLMFKAKNGEVYGLIRSLGLYPEKQETCSLCLTEEKSIWEVFINVKGRLYKGCAVLKD